MEVSGKLLLVGLISYATLFSGFVMTGIILNIIKKKRCKQEEIRN